MNGFIVYVLFSLKDRRLYIGMTKNIHRRLQQHRRGEVGATRYRRPLSLIYFEKYAFQEDAERREKYLKGGNGRAALKIQLQTHLKKVRYRYLK